MGGGVNNENEKGAFFLNIFLFFFCSFFFFCIFFFFAFFVDILYFLFRGLIMRKKNFPCYFFFIII